MHSILSLTTAVYVDDWILNISWVLLRWAWPIATLSYSNSTLLMLISWWYTSYLDLIISSCSWLQLLWERSTTLRVLLLLSSLLLLIQFDLLFMQLLARSEIEIINYVGNIGNTITWLLTLCRLTWSTMLLLVLEICLNLRNLRLTIAFSIVTLNVTLAMWSLSQAFLFMTFYETRTHLLTLTRVKATSALESFVVTDTVLTSTNLGHINASRTLGWYTTSIGIAQVCIGTFTIV